MASKKKAKKVELKKVKVDDLDTRARQMKLRGGSKALGSLVKRVALEPTAPSIDTQQLSGRHRAEHVDIAARDTQVVAGV